MKKKEPKKRSRHRTSTEIGQDLTKELLKLGDKPYGNCLKGLPNLHIVRDKDGKFPNINMYTNKSFKELEESPTWIIDPTHSHSEHRHENLLFYKVLSGLSVIYVSAVAYLSNWQYETLVTRFEYLKWLIFGSHPGMH